MRLDNSAEGFAQCHNAGSLKWVMEKAAEVKRKSHSLGLVQAATKAVKYYREKSDEKCPIWGYCTFRPLLRVASRAVVYDERTLGHIP